MSSHGPHDDELYVHRWLTPILVHTKGLSDFVIKIDNLCCNALSALPFTHHQNNCGIDSLDSSFPKPFLYSC